MPGGDGAQKGNPDASVIRQGDGPVQTVALFDEAALLKLPQVFVGGGGGLDVQRGADFPDRRGKALVNAVPDIKSAMTVPPYMEPACA